MTVDKSKYKEPLKRIFDVCKSKYLRVVALTFIIIICVIGVAVAFVIAGIKDLLFMLHHGFLNFLEICKGLTKTIREWYLDAFRWNDKE